jgi:hypothetical protein
VTDSAAYLLALGVTFVVNVPFGYWPAGVRKFSPLWFVAVHAAGIISAAGCACSARLSPTGRKR